jgi:hypothetical protein
MINDNDNDDDDDDDDDVILLITKNTTLEMKRTFYLLITETFYWKEINFNVRAFEFFQFFYEIVVNTLTHCINE